MLNSDQDLMEDPEALVNGEKCYLIKRNREPAKRKTVEDQKEEVETALKSLSLKQPKTPGLGNSNDRVAFIQSGRVCDKVIKLCKEGGNMNNDSKVESEFNSTSN